MRQKVVRVDNAEDIKDDEHAQAIISLNLGKGFIHHIANKATAKAMWDELSKLYGAISKHSKISLKIKFFHLEMKLGEQLGNVISQMKSIITQLAFIVVKVDPDDAIDVLLKSMPIEYNSLVTRLTRSNLNVDYYFARIK